MTNDEWKKGATEKGKPIIGERIRGALDKWSAEWGPKYDVVTAKVATLPPSTLDFRANITNRLVPTVEAWKKAAGKL